MRKIAYYKSNIALPHFVQEIVVATSRMWYWWKHGQAEKTPRGGWPVERARCNEERNSLAESNASDRQQMSWHCPEWPQRNTVTASSSRQTKKWTRRMQIPHTDATCTSSSIHFTASVTSVWSNSFTIHFQC